MAVMNMHSNTISVASTGNYINSVCHELVDVTFPSCILGCNKCPVEVTVLGIQASG